MILLDPFQFGIYDSVIQQTPQRAAASVLVLDQAPKGHIYEHACRAALHSFTVQHLTHFWDRKR